MPVGWSVTTRSHLSALRDISISGALAVAARMLASGIWGRQVSYQMVLCWEVQVAPARSATLAAFSYLLPSFTRVTMVA